MHKAFAERGWLFLLLALSARERDQRWTLPRITLHHQDESLASQIPDGSLASQIPDSPQRIVRRTDQPDGAWSGSGTPCLALAVRTPAAAAAAAAAVTARGRPC